MTTLDTSHIRALRLAHRLVANYTLNLRGLVVYTEAATGAYAYTACMAALAGARVIALGGANRFSTAQDALDATYAVARQWGVAENITFVDTKHKRDLAQADILTNSGNVRPIDACTIAALKPTAVIPLMWETFEWRPAELDLAACHDRGILTMGTDEQRLDFVAYAAEAVVRQLHAHGLAVHHGHIFCLGSGLIMRATTAGLSRYGAQVLRSSWEEEPNDPLWRAISSHDVVAFMRGCDAVLCDERADKRPLLGGKGSLMDVYALARHNPSCLIINRHGVVDTPAILSSGMTCVPSPDTASWHTPHFTTAILGRQPVMELMAAGLKVGEAMARARLDGLTLSQAAVYAMATAPAQDFAPPHAWLLQESPRV